MDTITINQLELWTRLGVPESERSVEQKVLVTIDMHVDTHQVGQSDDIEDTVDYDDVVQALQKAANEERSTLEKLCEDISDIILSDFGVQNVTITAEKFALADTASVAVTITRP